MATAAAVVPASAAAATPWVGLQSISALGTPGIAPSISPVPPPPVTLLVTPSGAAATVWVAADGSVLASRRGGDGAWAAAQQISTAGQPGGSGAGIDATIDDAGDITVMYATNAGSGAVLSSTSLLGAAFGTPVVIATGVKPSTLDVATNATGQSVAVFGGIYATSSVYATTKASPAAGWTAPVLVSDQSLPDPSQFPNAAHGGYSPHVDINASGRAVAVWLDTLYTSSNTYTFKVVGLVRTAGSDWSAAGLATVEGSADASTEPIPVIDAGGQITVLTRAGGSVYVVPRAANSPTFTVDQPVTNGCSSGSGNYGGQIALAADGSRTIIFSCNGTVYAITRATNTAPGGSFTNGLSGAQTLATSAGVPTVAFDENGAGQAAALISDGTTTRVYRRASTGGIFGAGEALVEPDQTFAVEDIGLDHLGNAIAVVGVSRVVTVGAATYGGYDFKSAVLDATPPVGAIDGPTTAYVGELVTYKSAFTDAFGGLVGNPSWTSTDGANGNGPTFDRTFVAPGTYKVTAAQSDIGGHPATASVTVTVTNRPPPTPTSTPAPAGGAGDSASTNTTITTTNTTNTGILMPPTAQPSITAASLSTASFKVLAGKKGGSALSVTLNLAATVDGIVSLQTAGVSSTVSGAPTCAAPKKGKAVKGKTCVRLVPKGTLHLGSLAAGTTKIAITGKVGNRKLAPGKYTLSLQIPGTNVTKVLTFTIKRS